VVKIILAWFDLSKKSKLPLCGMGCRNIHTKSGSNILNCGDKTKKPPQVDIPVKAS
jgi:hypothetical protein